MCQLIESICLINGKIRNLYYHQKRFSQSQKVLFGIKHSPDIGRLIMNSTPPKKGKYKCRILYNQQVQSIQFLSYQIKPINSIKIIEHDNLDYSYKYSNRKVFNSLKAKTDKHEIIIAKNGLITDTSYSNLAFFNGYFWSTPSAYLLNGTMRQALLNQGKIKEKDITLKNINQFTSVKLINAMITLEESPELDTSIIST